MKQISITLIVFVVLGFFSCEEKKKEQPKPPVEIRTLEELPNIVEAHGIIGEGTTMNVMEFISDECDTVYIRVPGQAVMGGIHVGDEVKVIYNISKDDVYASVTVNLTSLQHLWSQRGANGCEQSLELNSGGRAATYNMSVDYDSWEVKAGQLLLHVPKRIGDEAPAVVDTFEIMQLTSDSLVLMNGDFMTEFERYN